MSLSHTTLCPVEDKIIEYAYIEWKIKTLNFADDFHFCIRSASFRLAYPVESSWCLGLEWNPKKRKESFVTLYLVRLLHSNNNEFYGRCRFGYYNLHDSIQWMKQDYFGHFPRKHVVEKQTELNRTKINASLKIACEIVLQRDHQSERKQKNNPYLLQLLTDMDKLCSDFKSHDVNFYIRQERYSAHKFLICARCPRFSFYFAQRDTYYLPDDTDTDAFEQLCLYCYRGNNTFLEHSILSFQLRSLACFYGLKLLTIKEIFLETKPTWSGRFRFKWKVKNFTELRDQNQVLSPEMVMIRSKAIKCHLMLMKIKQFVWIYFNMDYVSSPMDLCVRISVQGKVGNEDYEITRSFLCKPQTILKEVYPLDLNVLKNFISDDTLTVICETVYSNFDFRSNLIRELELATTDVAKLNELEKLSDFMATVFKHENFTDVTIKAGGRNFRTHREFLKIRSPYFAKLFKTRKEDKPVRVKVSADVMDVMLNYIYSGKLNTTDPNILQRVYHESDKYPVNLLKEA